MNKDVQIKKCINIEDNYRWSKDKKKEQYRYQLKHTWFHQILDITLRYLWLASIIDFGKI